MLPLLPLRGSAGGVATIKRAHRLAGLAASIGDVLDAPLIVDGVFTEQRTTGSKQSSLALAADGRRSGFQSLA
jgi:hypothetical protein